jgi:peptide-methionine (S)-S-oxide reductase
MSRSYFVPACFVLVAVASLFVSAATAQDSDATSPATAKARSGTSDRQVAVFGGGCFWCIEAVFERVLGVQSVESGYAGGNVPNPTYQMVSTDQTGHAEVCRIEFDPEVISYEDLVRIFFKSHDPTLLNAQGPDHGTRYRSVILYADEEQKKTVETVLEEFRKKRSFRGKVVTEVSPLRAFYRAEEYHQDYFAKHPDQPYCEINIRPKIGKFERSFKEFSKVQKAKNDRKEKSDTKGKQ